MALTFAGEISLAYFDDLFLLFCTANSSKSPSTSATSDSDSEKAKRRPGGYVRVIS